MDILKLPVLCTRGMIVFPGHELSIDVGRSYSLKAVNQAISDYSSQIIIVSQIRPLDEEISYDSIYHTGTLATIIKRVKKDNHGTIR